jgi:putative transposase
MPWEGVTVSEQKQRFIEDYLLNYYSITELARRFSITRKTAHKWISRYLEQGPSGLEDHSRRPQSCPWQTDPAVAAEIVALREKHPSWGPKKLLNVLSCRNPGRVLPSIPTAARILDRAGLVKPRRRYRRAHPGCPQTKAAQANDIWPADYKGQFRLKNGAYCFPLTVSDLATRYILGVDAHPTISLEHTFAHFRALFKEYGLPKRIRTDNGVPFASNALARLSQLSVWFIKLGIYPELIEPGKPQQPVLAD